MRLVLQKVASAAVAAGIAAFHFTYPVIAGFELPCDALSTETTRTVIRVIDGETLALDDGRELRLTSTLTPRAIDVDAEAGAWQPETAAMAALEQLALGKSIQVAFAGDRTDRYGRILAHAFLIEGSERRWLQGDLLEQGHARVYARQGNRVCIDELLRREHEAREAGRGLWRDAAYQVRSVTASLAAYRGTFQIVEGVVSRVAVRRGSIYLNFDRRTRRDFSALLRTRDKELLGSFADRPEELAGSKVRVRGWIEERRGNSINLSASGLIEIVDTTPSAAEKHVRP